MSHYHNPYYTNPVWLEREQMLADELRPSDLDDCAVGYEPDVEENADE